MRLPAWSEVQIVCIWSSWCHCVPRPHYPVPHFTLSYRIAIVSRLAATCTGRAYVRPRSTPRTGGAVGLGLLLAWSLLELRLAEVQHGARATIQTHLLLVRETEHRETVLSNRPTTFVSASGQHTYVRNTHARLTALFPELPGWAGTRKVKPIWILLKQETESGSGISWATGKSHLAPGR